MKYSLGSGWLKISNTKFIEHNDGYLIYKRQRIPKGQSQMDIPVKLTT